MLVVGARGDVRDYDQVLDTVGKEMGKVKILRPERQGTETLRLKSSSLTRMEGQRNLVSDGYAHFGQPRGEEPSALACRKSAGRSKLVVKGPLALRQPRCPPGAQNRSDILVLPSLGNTIPCPYNVRTLC
jgi:hypothetical protein